MSRISTNRAEFTSRVSTGFACSSNIRRFTLDFLADLLIITEKTTKTYILENYLCKLEHRKHCTINESKLAKLQRLRSRGFFPPFWLNHKILKDECIILQQRLHPHRKGQTHWRLLRLLCYLVLVHPSVHLKSSNITNLKPFTCSRVILSIVFLFFVLVRKREAHFLFLLSVCRWPDSNIAWSQSNFPLLPIGSTVIQNTQF